MVVTADLRIHSVLAGYRIEALIGHGGMGVVYLAHDLSLERKVALKLLAPELSSDDGFRERFLRESRLAASIDHPNVIPIYEAGEAEGVLFIAMRYVEGTDLKRLLESEGRLEPARAIALLRQVAEALDVAHEHGLVHRDVKPANMLLATQAGREHVYLADFGLSREAAAHGALERSHFSGSADYAAPEQIQRQPLDGGADLYALACVLYHCLTGEPPYRRESLIGTLFAHLNDDPPSATAANRELPEEIDVVLSTALAKESQERQATCAQLVDEARNALGISDRPTWRRLPRRTKLAVALIALAIAAAAAVPALLLTGGGPAALVIEPGSLVRVDPQTNRAVASLRIGPPLSLPGSYDVEAGLGSVWLTGQVERSVRQIDPQTAGVRRTIQLDGTPNDATVGAASVWVVGRSADGSALTELDPATGEILHTYQLPFTDATSVLEAEGAVWVGGDDLGDRSVLRIDPVTGALLATIPVEPVIGSGGVSEVGTKLRWLEEADGAIWTASKGGALFRIDPAPNEVIWSTSLPERPAGMATGFGSVWVDVGDTILRFDARTTDLLASIRKVDDSECVDIATGEDSVWAATCFGNLTRIEPAVDQIQVTIPLGRVTPIEIAVGEGSVWLVGT